MLKGNDIIISNYSQSEFTPYDRNHNPHEFNERHQDWLYSRSEFLKYLCAVFQEEGTKEVAIPNVRKWCNENR